MTARNELVIGSRGSRLALWQAEHIRGRLRERHPGLEVRIEVIQTTGDRVTGVALSRIGSQGIFTKEIEEALLAGGVDLAVHSLKDLPTALPVGLAAGVITARLHGEDCLVSRDQARLAELPAGARVGTSSLRRKVQLAARRSDLAVLDIRGNVDTRLAKLERGEFEALVLARAGLERLGFGGLISEVLPPELMLPAPGQGALALEYRERDARVRELIAFLADPRTMLETAAEREFLHELGGGCQVPIGALAEVQQDGSLRLTGLISDLEGKKLLRDSLTARPEERPGKVLAQRMLAGGGRELLREILFR